ncbi:YbgC/FadM family acyl-CoA thioesterase [Pelagibacteraceae bacterium]|jgi:acyl-CoA thioester hydrolase|nr:YbgC/FadM family acyl-CoA thioesterase [Pelagibacteraceae bacterium]
MSENYTYTTRVYYEDTDAGGIVYYANYLKFIERARTEMIYKQLELTHQKLKDQYDVIFVVRICNIKYHKSAKFEDILTVNTNITKKSLVRISMLQEVRKKNVLIVGAEVELAIINSKGEVKKIPEELLKKI